MSSYSQAGVKSADEIPGFAALLQHLKPTFGYAPGARPVIEFGYYANVIPVAPNLGIAISTDGVGTKILIAEALGKYDTIGIDCVAMNVNDVICVGARPLSMVDYIAVERADDYLLSELGKGFAEGARRARISIPGGEFAQVPGMVRGLHEGQGFDLVGTAIGTVPLDKVLTGEGIKDGDVVIGLASSGVHSNGLTLARKFVKDLSETIPEARRTIGEELLEPTTIYVDFATAVFEAGLAVRGMAHITGDGFLNLLRVRSHVSFVLDNLPRPQPVFDFIQQAGEIESAEMYRVFNMGIGFVTVAARDDADAILLIAKEQGYEGQVIGFTRQESEARVHLTQHRLAGDDRGQFLRV